MSNSKTVSNESPYGNETDVKKSAGTGWHQEVRRQHSDGKKKALQVLTTTNLSAPLG